MEMHVVLHDGTDVTARKRTIVTESGLALVVIRNFGVGAPNRIARNEGRIGILCQLYLKFYLVTVHLINRPLYRKLQFDEYISPSRSKVPFFRLRTVERSITTAALYTCVYLFKLQFLRISISPIPLSCLVAKHDAAPRHRVPSISIHDRSRQRGRHTSRER